SGGLRWRAVSGWVRSWPDSRDAATRMSAIHRLAIFCGSNPGSRPEHVAGARAFGRLLAERGIGVAYGGSSVGLMAAVAEAVLRETGDTHGGIPKSVLQRGGPHK